MNIAEILKYCPKGTKLYSLADGEVTLESICNTGQYNIEVVTDNGNTSYFTKDGKMFADRPNGECVLFPSKDQRDWSKFRLPVKRGDIMMIPNTNHAFIATGKFTDKSSIMFVCGIDVDNELIINPSNAGWTKDFYIPASEEAKKELFDKMKEAGYRWNADTLKLEPEFKEGDVYINKEGDLYLLVSKITKDIGKAAILYPDGNFIAEAACALPVEGLTLATPSDKNKLFSFIIRKGYKYDKKQYKLVKQEFKPFDRVLVRNSMYDNWISSLFSHYNNETNEKYPFICINNYYYSYCIPYEGNEYLLGTANSPT